MAARHWDSCSTMWQSVMWLDEQKFAIVSRIHGLPVFGTKEPRDHLACYQPSVPKPAFLMVWRCISHYGMKWKHQCWNVYTGLRATYTPIQTVSYSGLVYFSKTMLNCILLTLYKHDFIKEESRCWTGLLEPRPFIGWKHVAVFLVSWCTNTDQDCLAASVQHQARMGKRSSFKASATDGSFPLYFYKNTFDIFII